jgi:hypothetical protein
MCNKHVHYVGKNLIHFILYYSKLFQYKYGAVE